MEEIVELRKVLAKHIHLEKYEVMVNSSSVKDLDSLLVITNPFPSFQPTGLRVQVEHLGYCIAGFTIFPFPACCGKCILHSLYLQRSFAWDNESVKTLTTEQMYEIWIHLLRFARAICKMKNYSSYMLIVSQNEQPTLKEIMDMCTGLKHTWMFRNKRYNPPHDIYEYSVEFDRTEIS